MSKLPRQWSPKHKQRPQLPTARYQNYAKVLAAHGDRTTTTSARNPNSHFKAWSNVLINNLKTKVKPNPAKPALVDDHGTGEPGTGTTIGNGYTLGVAAGVLYVTQRGLQQIPVHFRNGLFKAGKYNVCTRFSEAPASGMHLARLAAKVQLGQGRELDLLTTETKTNFPIADNKALSIFVQSETSTLQAAVRALWYAGTTKKLVANNPPTVGELGMMHLPLQPLGRSFYSMVPFAVKGSGAGEIAVFKFSFVPRDATRRAFVDKEMMHKCRHVLRSKVTSKEKYAQLKELATHNTKFTMADSVRRGLKSKQPVEYDLRVQFSTDPRTEPLNDATVRWNTPEYTIGTLRIPAQTCNADGVSSLVKLDNSKRLSFVPGKIHKSVGDVGAFRHYLYPHYDRARQQHLLGNDGTAQKCPFAHIAANMNRKK
ncbi:hypothetical protein OAM67_01210 [bacterium]|nr:hypothetical protein [bacterium]